MRQKRLENLAAFSAKEVEKAAAEVREKWSIPLQKDSEDRSESKVIPTSFLKIEGRSTFVGVKNRRKEDS